MFEEIFDGLYDGIGNDNCGGGMENSICYYGAGDCFGGGDGSGAGNGFSYDTNAFGNGGNESFNDILDQEDLEVWM